jgi:hypothetical protein
MHRRSYQEPLNFHQPKGPKPVAYDNNMTGVLFREQNKKSEKSPDMTGSITIDGVRYRLAGWTREGKDGRKFLSLAASLPEEQRTSAQTSGDRTRPVFEKRVDDEIPF